MQSNSPATEQPTYSLWFDFAPGDAQRVQREIQTVSRSLDLPFFAPHITVVGGFKVAEGRVRDTLKTLTESVAPFTVELGNLRHDDVWNRAAIVLAEAPELHEMNKWATELLGLDPAPYEPHTSLAYADNVEAARIPLVAGAAQRLGEILTVEGVSLWQTPGAGAFQVPEWTQLAAATFMGVERSVVSHEL